MKLPERVISLASSPSMLEMCFSPAWGIVPSGKTDFQCCAFQHCAQRKQLYGAVDVLTSFEKLLGSAFNWHLGIEIMAYLLCYGHLQVVAAVCVVDLADSGRTIALLHTLHLWPHRSASPCLICFIYKTGTINPFSGMILRSEWDLPAECSTDHGTDERKWSAGEWEPPVMANIKMAMLWGHLVAMSEWGKVEWSDWGIWASKWMLL